jgi:hypothetical protein
MLALTPPRKEAPAMYPRILVVANETCPAATLHEAVRGIAGDAEADVLVVAPALNGWVATWATDIDGATERARSRLRHAVAALHVLGLDVEGTVGDANPLTAIEDALRWFPADAIVISTHPPGRSRWLARNVATRAAERFALPVTHVIVDVDREATELAAPNRAA